MNKYSDELKREALARVAAGESRANVAKDLKLSSPKLFTSWMTSMEVKIPNVARRIFSEEVKRAAVARVLQGESMAAVNKDLSLAPSVLGRWKREYSGSEKRKLKQGGAPTGGKSGARASEEVRAAAVARLKTGEAAAAIAEELGVHVSTLHSWNTKGNGKGNGSGNGHSTPDTHDALIYLRQAKKRITAEVSAGKATVDNPVYMLAMLALNSLEGKM